MEIGLQLTLFLQMNHKANYLRSRVIGETMDLSQNDNPLLNRVRATKDLLDVYFITDVSTIILDFLNQFKAVCMLSMAGTGPLGVLASGDLIFATPGCWELFDGAQRRSLNRSPRRVGVMVALQGNKLAVIGNFRIDIWINEIPSFSLSVDVFIRAIVGMSNNRLAVSAGHTVSIWSLDSKKVLSALIEMSFVSAMVTFDDNHLICGYASGAIVCWNVELRKALFHFTGHADEILCLAMLPDNRLMSGSRDFTCRVWNLATFTCELVMQHQAVVNAVAFVDVYFVTGSATITNSMCVWDSTGTLLMQSGTNSITNLVMLPNGSLASSSNDEIVCVWK